MEQYKIMERKHPSRVGSGTQKIYRFPNDYGASVVRFYVGGFPASYGAEDSNWEIGVIKFTGDDWNLTYDTPITSDVIGYLNDEGVVDVLQQIKALPKGE